MGQGGLESSAKGEGERVRGYFEADSGGPGTKSTFTEVYRSFWYALHPIHSRFKCDYVFCLVGSCGMGQGGCAPSFL